MRVVIFGATGMIGQGVLRECLRDPEVTGVFTVGRAVTGQRHDKLREIARADLFDVTPIADDLTGLDACFFCLGVSAAGMSEEQYRRLTYDLTLAVARTLAERNPDMTFVYVSGQGTDSTERGRTMWARVKGRTENALLDLPFQAYMFRPGYIQPMHGARSRTRIYRAVYAVAAPLFPLVRRIAPHAVTTTEQVGRAMIEVARAGAAERVLGPRQINELAARG